MNEKIKELAKKSGATFLQSTDGKVEYIDYNQTFFDIEQFANLIIQECLENGIKPILGEHVVLNEIQK